MTKIAPLIGLVILTVLLLTARPERTFTQTGGTGGATEVTLRAASTDLEAIRESQVASEGALEAINNKILADATAYQTALTTGPQGMVRADSTRPTAATDGQAIQHWSTLDGAAVVTPIAHTLGGCTPGSSISGAAVLETEIKATAGQLYFLSVTTNDATPVFAKVYNDTAANTDQTDTPNWRFMVPTGTSANAGGFMGSVPVGTEFSTAITIRVTTGAADNDTGALAANEVYVSWCVK